MNIYMPADKQNQAEDTMGPEYTNEEIIEKFNKSEYGGYGHENAVSTRLKKFIEELEIKLTETEFNALLRDWLQKEVSNE